MIDPSQFATLNVSAHTLVLLVFYIVTGVYTIFSGILYYHWREYATDPKVTAYTLIAYFALTLPLILVMGILAVIIN
jgi:hypothetical protein